MPPKQESLGFLAELMQAGKLTPHVERIYPLAQVPEAIRHLETGRVKGKLVVALP